MKINKIQLKNGSTCWVNQQIELKWTHFAEIINSTGVDGKSRGEFHGACLPYLNRINLLKNVI